jgi:hypothetical protein
MLATKDLFLRKTLISVITFLVSDIGKSLELFFNCEK